jgi:LPS-assembly lipoprotein
MRSAAWVMLCAVAAFSACGFQLQGRQKLPESLTVVYLDASDRQSDFTHALRAVLVASGTRMARLEDADVTHVRIVMDELTERVLSVDIRNIPTDFELVHEVEITVTRGATDLMPAEKFSLTRIYSFDERRLLAKEREKEILAEALARDMASVVARRLSTL